MNKILAFILILLSFNSYSNNQVIGKTYEISEPSPYAEIERKSKEIDFTKLKSKALKKKTFINSMREAPLPKTLNNRTRLITPSAKAPADIYRKDGSILYAKGYEFNPLNYRKLSGRIILVDQEDLHNMDFISTDTVMINKGDLKESSEIINMPVFIFDKFTSSTLDIMYSPTIITQVGSSLEYKELILKEVGK